jgi:ankyrin repeat protein
MSDRFITNIDELNALPGFPSIGSILNKYTAAIGGKEFPKGTPALRKKLQLLSVESSEVDFDSYIDVLNATLESYKLITKDLPFHWIDEAQLYHYFRAYQQLILNFPVFGLTRQLIDNLAAYYFVFMSVQRYVWMIKTYEAKARLFTPHFLIAGNASLQKAFRSIISNAKRLLQKDQISDWKFIGILYPELMGDKDKRISQDKAAISELVDQLTSWGTTPDSPKYITFLEKIINPLRAVDEIAASVLEVDFVAWKWLAFMIRDSNLSFVSLSNWLSKYFNQIINADEIMEYQIPSDFTMHKEVLQTRIQTLSQSLLADFCTDEEYYRWQNTSLMLDIELPPIEQSGAEIIWEYINALAYCSSSDFIDFSTEYFQYCIEKRSPDIRNIFRKQFLHGLLPNSYSSSVAWIDRQTEPLLHGNPVLINSGELAKWMASTNQKNINRPKKWGRYYRTRLMHAVTGGEPEQVRKFLNLGADPLWISENSSKQPGDNGSALLFALQRLEDSSTPKSFDTAFEIVNIVIDALIESPRDEVRKCISLPTNLKKISPLSIAIYSGQIDILSRLLNFQPNLSSPLGGDDFFPIYAAVNAFFQMKKMKEGFKFTTDVIKKGNFNPLRMAVPNQVWQMLEEGNPVLEQTIDSIFQQKQCWINVSEQDMLDIIELLVSSGAEVNKMSPNGRYPLDLALEVSATFNDPVVVNTLNNLGEFKRAVL